MKILFIDDADDLDYQSDVLFHGLVSAGCDVTDANYVWYMSAPTQSGDARLYGLGFTLAGTLPDRSGIDRTKIRERIRAHEFDLVVYGSVRRCKDYLDDVLSSYSRTEIAFVDGMDDADVPFELIRKGLVFKRELREDRAGVYPINFGIPESKILSEVPRKTTNVSSTVPYAARRYRYSDESKYYASYSRARFARTCRRSGWDCLRHYEILANRCVPVFDIDDLPAQTMVPWPRKLQLEANALYRAARGGEDVATRWDRLEAKFHDALTSSMTTRRVAECVLRIVRAEQSRPVDWMSRFDRVFCIHSTLQDFKLPLLFRELSRVGLLGSPVFEMRYASPSPWDAVIRENEPEPVAADGIANLGLESCRVMRESLNRGYDRILIIENDATFLKDTTDIQRHLDGMPDRDIVQLDHFFCLNDPFKSNCARSKMENKIGNGMYFDPKDTIFYSGTAIAYSRKAMEAMAKYLDRRPTAPDGELEKLDVTRAISTESVAVQTVYSGCITSDLSSHHRGYGLAGLDYSNYAFPPGYGSGAYVDRETGTVVSPSTDARAEREIAALKEKLKTTKSRAARAIVMHRIGLSYAKLDNEDLAELWFRRGIAEDRNKREHAYEFAKWAYSKSRWPALLLACGTLLRDEKPRDNSKTELARWSWEPYDWIGLALWYTGHHDLAKVAYEDAVRRFPNVKHLAENLTRCG